MLTTGSGCGIIPPMAASAVPRDLVVQLVRDAKRRGVDYADVRYEHLLHESLLVEQGRVSSVSLHESAGIGIRVLLNGSWGFASTPHLVPAHLKRAVSQAIGLAKASASINRRPRPLAAARGAGGVARR